MILQAISFGVPTPLVPSQRSCIGFDSQYLIMNMFELRTQAVDSLSRRYLWFNSTHVCPNPTNSEIVAIVPIILQWLVFTWKAYMWHFRLLANVYVHLCSLYQQSWSNPAVYPELTVYWGWTTQSSTAPTQQDIFSYSFANVTNTGAESALYTIYQFWLTLLLHWDIVTCTTLANIGLHSS